MAREIVTDQALLAQLDSGTAAPPEREVVTDPALLAQLDEPAVAQRPTGLPLDAFVKNLEANDLFGSFSTAMSGAWDKGIHRDEEGRWNTPDMLPGDESLTGGLKVAAAALSQKGGGRDTRHTPLIDKFQKEHNLTDEQVKTMWGDLGNAYRPWKDDEELRIQSDGGILPNPTNSAWLDDTKVKGMLARSGASQQARQTVLDNLPQIRANIAGGKLEAYEAAFQANKGAGFTLGTLSGLANLAVAPQSPSDWAKATGQEATNDPKFVRDYEKAVIDEIPWAQKKAIGLTGKWNLGWNKVATQMLGLAGIAGSDAAARMAAEASEAGETIGQGLPGTGLVGDVVQEIPSLGAQVVSARMLGTLGAIATRSTKAQQALSAIGAYTTAGAQSAGITYASEMAEHGDDGKARGRALKAGLATSIITAAFGVKGVGGVESVAAGNVGNVTMRTLLNQGLRESTKNKDFFRFLGNAITAAGGEATEEAIDEFYQAFITADPDESLAGAWDGAMQAAKVGGVAGGAVNVAGGMAVDPVLEQAQRMVSRSAEMAPEVAEEVEKDVRMAEAATGFVDDTDTIVAPEATETAETTRTQEEMETADDGTPLPPTTVTERTLEKPEKVLIPATPQEAITPPATEPDGVPGDPATGEVPEDGGAETTAPVVAPHETEDVAGGEAKLTPTQQKVRTLRGQQDILQKVRDCLRNG